MMFSTSSSECDCDEIYGYNTVFRNVPEAQFVQTLRQPLIYYAQVDPFRRQNRSDTRKNNPNCFARAFRWYTQGRQPSQRKKLSNNPDWSGFANWLDDKYHQYIREKHMNRDTYVNLQQTSVIEANKINKSAVCEPCKPKLFTRVRSPWKRRHRPNSKDHNHVGKSCHSFEYIMKPKVSSQLASEFCRPSNAAVASVETNSRKIKPKSYSLTSIRVCEIDNKHTGGTYGLNNVRTPEQQTSGNVNEIKTIYEFKGQRSKTPSQNYKDVCCQCEGESVKKVDANTQFEESSKTNTYCSECCLKNHYYNQPITSVNEDQKETIPQKILNRRKDIFKSVEKASERSRKANQRSKTDIMCQCANSSILKLDAHTQYQPNSTNQSDFCPSYCSKDSYVKQDPLSLTHRHTNIAQEQIQGTSSRAAADPAYFATPKKPSCFPIFINDAAQTSDHSIQLNKEKSVYPLFMKIIRADKLNDEALYAKIPAV